MLVNRFDHSSSWSENATVGLWECDLLVVNFSTCILFLDSDISSLVQMSVRERNGELGLILIGLPLHNLAAIALRVIFLNHVLTAPVPDLNPSFLSHWFENRKKQQLDHGIGRDLPRVHPWRAPVVSQSFGFDSRHTGWITFLIFIFVLHHSLHLVSLSFILLQGVILWHCNRPDLIIKAA